MKMRGIPPSYRPSSRPARLSFLPSRSRRGSQSAKLDRTTLLMVLTMTLFASSSWNRALLVAAQPKLRAGLTVEMCQSYMRQADTPPIGDNSGGIHMRNGEYAEFIRLLGQSKCFEDQLRGAPGGSTGGVTIPNGIQSLLFLNLMCGTLAGTPGVECNDESEIPVDTMNATMVQTVCQKVDSLILSSCPPTTTPITGAPVPAPNPSPTPPQPSAGPVSERSQITIAPGLTVADCEQDLVQSDTTPQNEAIDVEEYGTFLLTMGERVCFDYELNEGNFIIARDAIFAQLQCFVQPSGCEGATSQQAVADDEFDLNTYRGDTANISYLCELSYNLALNAATCANPPPPPSNNNAPSPPQASPPNNTPSPPTISPSPTVSSSPTIRSSIQPSALRNEETETRGSSATRQSHWLSGLFSITTASPGFIYALGVFVGLAVVLLSIICL